MSSTEITEVEIKAVIDVLIGEGIVAYVADWDLRRIAENCLKEAAAARSRPANLTMRADTGFIRGKA